MSEFKTLKTEEEKEPQEEIINYFGRDQVIVDCKYCEKRVLTEIEIESTWTGILLSVVLLIIFRILSIPLIIMLIPLTQQTTHRCPSCLNKIGQSNFYDLFSLGDKVFTFSIGTFALIISKKLLLGFFCCGLMVIIVVYFFSFVSTNGINLIPDTWDEYHKFCSPNEFLKNYRQAKLYCAKYRYSDVSWDGFVVRVDYDHSFISKYKISMLVKMEKDDPTEEGDLYLKIDESRYNSIKNVIYNVSRGDHIFFNATVINEGSDRMNLLAEPFDLLKKEDFIKINPHIHHHGRYSLDANRYSDVHNTYHKDEKVYEELSEFKVEEEVDTNIQKESYH